MHVRIYPYPLQPAHIWLREEEKNAVFGASAHGPDPRVNPRVASNGLAGLDYLTRDMTRRSRVNPSLAGPVGLGQEIWKTHGSGRVELRSLSIPRGGSDRARRFSLIPRITSKHLKRLAGRLESARSDPIRSDPIRSDP